MIIFWLQYIPWAFLIYPMPFGVKKIITGAAQWPNVANFGKRW